MNPIASFNRQNLPEVLEAINKALKQVADQYGLKSISCGVNVSMDTATFRTQLNGEVKDELNKEKQITNECHSKMMGYNASIVGEIFIHSGKDYRVDKLEVNRPKYPLVATELSTGRVLKFTNKNKFNFKNPAIVYDATKNVFAGVPIG